MHTHHKVSKTLISIFTLCLLFHVRFLSFWLMHSIPPGHGRKGKVVVFQVRYYPLTQTADHAEPVMDGKWTAVDRQEDDGAVSTRQRHT